MPRPRKRPRRKPVARAKAKAKERPAETTSLSLGVVVAAVLAFFNVPVSPEEAGLLVAAVSAVAAAVTAFVQRRSA